VVPAPGQRGENGGRGEEEEIVRMTCLAHTSVGATIFMCVNDNRVPRIFF
jgi:hypothetical protein